jgi:myo-inositol-1-phosphate synthase
MIHPLIWRGNKEAWDVIDFRGIFDMPMSLRLNLQARDSILATPIIIDLVRWMELMHKQGFGGIANELSFYFKSPMGNSNLYNFQDQLYALYNLAKRLKGGGKSTFGFNAR